VFLIVAAVGAALLCIIAIPVLLLLPAISATREAARRNQCGNQLRQIGLAMMEYEGQYGTFPPAYIADENGTPMHSWRVLLLPYLEERTLYDRYNFDEPWNSPANLELATRLPPYIYRCPSASAGSTDQTHYMVVSGPQMAFEGDRALRIESFLDGTSKTILVVENTQSTVTWTEPVDLDATQMTFQINGGPGEIGSEHAGGVAMAVFADNHVEPLSEDLSPEEVRAMCTRNGDEPVTPW
jgi:hypothetical protein